MSAPASVSSGKEPAGTTPEQFNTFIRSEMKRWEPVVKATGAKIE